MCCVLRGARLWPAAEDAWGDAAFLRRELAGVPCSVLEPVTTASRRFSYWFSAATGHGADRVQAGYSAAPLVRTRTMPIDEFLREAARTPAAGVLDGHGPACLYLQQSILQADPSGSGGMLTAQGVGEMMRGHMARGIDGGALQQLAQAGGFGAWQRCQLFVGGAATVGAKSILHFDQYDNLFLQLRGTKRFWIADPTSSGAVEPFPVHHPLDTRAQLDSTSASAACASARSCASARAAAARGVVGREVVLRPGELLFLPSHWWHEVTTEGPLAPGELCVSVNFWFMPAALSLSATPPDAPDAPDARLPRLPRWPPLPLSPPLRLELARQLEYLVSDWLDDRARHVPAFFGALLDQLTQLPQLAAIVAATDAAADADAAVDAAAVNAAVARLLADAERREAAPAEACSDGGGGGGGGPWAPLHARRPADVAAGDWGRLAAYALFKLTALLGAHAVLPFVRDLCNPARFHRLKFV